MLEFIKTYQQDALLLFCGACGILIILLINTRFLSKSRKRILILMEAFAMLLLWFDRDCYIYGGVPGRRAYIMIRLANFMTFCMTSGIVFGFNMYLSDLLKNEGGYKVLPKRLIFTGIASFTGMVLAVVAAFTNLYYYFDEANNYHRGEGFLIAYIIPVICPLIQYTVIRQYRKAFSRLIYISLVLYIFVPVSCGILQIFLYGTSIVNLAMASVSLSLYVFMYLDLNNTVERAHEKDIKSMKGEQKRMQRLFDQTATAFVSAVEKKDEFMKGHAIRTAHYAKMIAERAGKSPEDCEKAYYAALLHDVGLIGIPDSVIKNDTDPNRRDYETMRQKPVIGAEILSSITEYPYLSRAARYSHERYNGTGYPEGRKGKDIPEIARIVGAADAYVTMTTRKRYRDAMPGFMAREAFLKGAGEEFDPDFAAIMVRIMDSEAGEQADGSRKDLETEIVCSDYRENVSMGIPVDSSIRRISFECERSEEPDVFSAPSIILFDSFDGRTHANNRDIERYGYLEYAEIWFDEHSVITAATKAEERSIEDNLTVTDPDGDPRYEIIAGRYGDHLKLTLRSADYAKEMIVALPNLSKASYIGLTGEHCRVFNIQTELTGEKAGEDYIPRIADAVSYIEHFESDIKNVQIDSTRSASTEGIEIGGRLNLRFHTMSFPEASLIWHCPYILIYSSDDGSQGGSDYREYDVIKLDGENQGSGDLSKNRFVMKKTEDFPGWDGWKERNKEGLDCEVTLERKGNQIILKTENLGIRLEDTITISEERSKVYAAITGDQIALTDISADHSH